MSSSPDNNAAAAMVEFLSTFETLSGTPPTSLEELSDGVALFECMAEIAPDYFDPTTIARHLGDNWALKSSNLRKLLRNMEHYFHVELKKTCDFFASFKVSEIARNESVEEISKLVHIVAAAAVTCQQKQQYIAKIMKLSATSQSQMKQIIQASLEQTSDYQGNEDEEEEDAELVFNQDKEEQDDEPEHLFENTTSSSTNAQIVEQSLTDLRREFAQFKSQASIREADDAASLQKLQGLVQDLQDRLVKRQDELIASEEELSEKTSQLESLQTELSTLQESHAQLADDLDVANAKALQLQKAETTVSAYRNKLEGVDNIHSKLLESEQQSASYLRQIVELESQVKKMPALQKQVQELKDSVKKLTKENEQAKEASVKATAELADTKRQWTAAESAKKMYQEELEQLKLQSDSHHDHHDALPAVGGLSLVDDAQSKEKTMRLEIENQNLQKELQELRASGGTAVASNSDEAVKKLQDQVERLTLELSEKESARAKLSSDKEKLEAYTKKTLAKFQEKYLVALQECKAKLKEKQDKIEVLESKSASEKAAQKREERLLSSTIYELGLSMMQNRLKER